MKTKLQITRKILIIAKNVTYKKTSQNRFLHRNPNSNMKIQFYAILKLNPGTVLQRIMVL